MLQVTMFTKLHQLGSVLSREKGPREGPQSLSSPLGTTNPRSASVSIMPIRLNYDVEPYYYS